MKISYNWLKWYVPDMPEADKLADVFIYHLCEVESVEKIGEGKTQDYIFDINILPNRAHDLLSHQGIARELSGLLGITFNDPTEKYKIPESVAGNLVIDSQTDACRRYTGRIVRNIRVQASPEWVVAHLASIGQRSINNIVDATNIVMYDCGQPCHAFDLRKITNSKIIIKNANQSEDLELLGSEKLKVTLNNSDIVIANDEGVTLGIAGVKGGLHSGVQDDTTEIVLEVANFDSVSVRKTARRLGILTDSAKRFENDLSPTHCDYAMRELSALILEMCPDAQFENIVNFEQKPPEKLRTISFATEKINNLLGTDITSSEIEQILQKYAFKYEINVGVFHMEIPALRIDLTSVNDVAEEIGRVIGYDKLVPVIPRIDFVPKKNKKPFGFAQGRHEKIKKIREILLQNGYNEVVTYAFCKSGIVEVAHGTGGEEFLRTNLSDGIKKSYELNRLNAPLLGLDEIKIFEIGNVFPKIDAEETRIAIADKKGVQEFSVEDFAEKIDDENNLAKLLIISKQNDTTKFICEFNSQISAKTEHFLPWSPFPFIARDTAVWVPENTDPKILVDIFVEYSQNLLARPPRLFDKFSKDSKISFAFRLVFQGQNKTLTDAETYTIVDNINNTLKNKGFEPR